MMSREMERWRVFFENSGEDLWSVIDWALTIAAVNYPKELRMRRDAFAEKLFAPTNYPLVPTNCGGGGGGGCGGGVGVGGGAGAKDEDRDHHDHDHRDDDEEILENVDHGRDPAPVDNDEESVRQELLSIGQSLKDDIDEPAEKLLKPIQRLEQLQVSIESLEVTGIGKIVNKLRKDHKSSRVKASCKRLVKHWKEIVDECVDKQKAADTAAFSLPKEAVNEVEVIEERLPHRVDLLSSSVSSVTQPPPLQMLLDHRNGGAEDSIFGCSPDDQRGEEEHHKSHRISYPPSEHSKMLDRPSSQPAAKWRPDADDDNRSGRTGGGGGVVAAPSNARKPPTMKFTQSQRPSFHESGSGSQAEKQKMETTKRMLHDQYQQAANVKRQRTVQVMAMQDVPQDRPGSHTSLKVGSAVNRRGAAVGAAAVQR